MFSGIPYTHDPRHPLCELNLHLKTISIFEQQIRWAKNDSIDAHTRNVHFDSSHRVSFKPQKFTTMRGLEFSFGLWKQKNRCEESVKMSGPPLLIEKNPGFSTPI